MFRLYLVTKIDKQKNSYLTHRFIDSFPRIIKLNKYKIEHGFVRPEGPKIQANKIGIHIMIFILIFVEKCL